MSRLAGALLVGVSLLLGSMGTTLAFPTDPLVPPNPIRDAARLDATCANPSGRYNHGAYVSYVARAFPNDPIIPNDPVCEVVPPVGED